MDESTDLPAAKTIAKALEAWRVADRAIEHANSAVDAPRRAAEAAANAAQAIAATAQQAVLTLEAAERARDTAALAAKEALEASGVECSKLATADPNGGHHDRIYSPCFGVVSTLMATMQP